VSTGANTGPVNTDMQTIATQGGALVQGAIQAGGHFIGRDFVQYVTNATQVGEDPRSPSPSSHCISIRSSPT
jgi:hypothetical protein